ncbi:MAG: acetylornithine deacetylase [Thermoanaerobaculia bacterium]
MVDATMTTLSDVELLDRLVGFDTTSRNSNLPLARFLADYLDRPGVEIRELPSPDGEKANLWVRLGPPLDTPGGDGERPGLVLSGHMDVVPADDVDRWSSDPFRLTDRGDRLVGRGSADMKGFLALAANAAAELDPNRLRHPLVLLLTYDEELGCLGAEHLAKSWAESWAESGSTGGGVDEPLPRAALVGEPTELRVVRFHKGHLKLRLDYRGVSAHSAYPHLGASAVEAAADGVQALTELRRELEDERVASSEHFPEAPFVTLNVGTIRGGAAINVVPDRCAVEVGVRLLPGMETEPMVERVRTAVGARLVTGAGEEAPDVSPRSPADSPRVEPPSLEVHSASPPLAVPEDAAILRTLLEATGQDRPDAVSYATDAGWLQHMGLDCAIWGPGSIEVAHKPDEWMPKADLARAREVLDGLVQDFCAPEA